MKVTKFPHLTNMLDHLLTLTQGNGNYGIH